VSRVPKALSYDVETTGLRPYEGDRMFAYSVCNTKGKAYAQRLDGNPLRQFRGRKRLEHFWADSGIPKVMHNAKFDLTFTERLLGRRLDDHEIHCTHKMSFLTANHSYSHSLDELAWLLGEYPRMDAEVRKLAKLAGGYDKVSAAKMEQYQLYDAERGQFLFQFFYPKILANPQWLDCYRTEMDLIRTTMRMEERGLMVRVDQTKQMIKELTHKVDESREALFRLAGKRFNPQADAQLRWLLYRKLRLPILKRTEKAKLAATDKEVLRQLKEKHPHQAIDLILMIRAYTKGRATLEDYLRIAGDAGIIHPTVNTCGAITGRESSENPNLQNVQKSGVLLNPYPVLAREAFRPRPGHILLLIDYSGIQMRLLIHYAGEEEMVRCLRKGDGDVHRLAAESFYGDKFTKLKQGSKPWNTYRGAAKNANFAVPFGAGTRKVVQVLGVGEAAGLQGDRRYRARFPKIVNLSRTVSTWVRRDGFVKTEFGRHIHTPRNKAYMGTNYLIQGTEADILKRAQNRVHRYNVTQTADEVKLLLMVHDEILLEYPRSRLSDLPGYLKDVRKLMIDFPMFDVPLEVDAQVATVSWEHKRKLPIPK